MLFSTKAYYVLSSQNLRPLPLKGVMPIMDDLYLKKLISSKKTDHVVNSLRHMFDRMSEDSKRPFQDITEGVPEVEVLVVLLLAGAGVVVIVVS